MVKSQVQNESKFLTKAQSLKLPTPTIIQTKPDDLAIYMEYKQGFESAKEMLSREGEPEDKSKVTIY